MSFKHLFFLLFIPFLITNCNNNDEMVEEDPPGDQPYIRCLVNGQMKEFSTELGGRGSNIGGSASIWSSPTFNLQASITFNFKNANEVTDQQIEDLEGQQFNFDFDDAISANFDLEIDNITNYVIQSLNNPGVHFLEVTNVYEDPQPFDPDKVYRVEGTFICKVSETASGSPVYDITEGEFSLLFSGT